MPLTLQKMQCHQYLGLPCSSQPTVRFHVFLADTYVGLCNWNMGVSDVSWPLKLCRGLAVLCLFPPSPPRHRLSSGRSLGPWTTSWSRASVLLPQPPWIVTQAGNRLLSCSELLSFGHCLPTAVSILWPIHFMSLNLKFLICRMDVVIPTWYIVMRIATVCFYISDY